MSAHVDFPAAGCLRAKQRFGATAPKSHQNLLVFFGVSRLAICYQQYPRLVAGQTECSVASEPDHDVKGSKDTPLLNADPYGLRVGPVALDTKGCFQKDHPDRFADID